MSPQELVAVAKANGWRGGLTGEVDMYGEVVRFSNGGVTVVCVFDVMGRMVSARVDPCGNAPRLNSVHDVALFLETV